MKKLKIFSLVFLIFILSSYRSYAASGGIKNIEDSSQSILIRQIPSYYPEEFDMYNISCKNYISLKSFARKILSLKSYYIEYDKEKDLVLIKEGLDKLDSERRNQVYNFYRENEKDGKLSLVEKEINFSIFDQDEIASIKGYNISGKNYVSLRDMARLLDFSLYYNYPGNNIVIDLEGKYEDQDRKSFVEKHRSEYESLRDFIIPRVKHLDLMSQDLRFGKEPGYGISYFKNNLVKLRDDFRKETDRRNENKLVDYNYYTDLYLDIEKLSFLANEIVYNLDQKQKQNKNPKYLNDYLDKFIEEEEKLQKNINIYFNFYKSNI